MQSYLNNSIVFLQPLIPTNRYLIQKFSSLLNQLHVRMFLTDITITESIIIDSIRELSSNSAAGPDGIPCSLLLNCAHELAPSLLILFKQSLSSGVIDPSLKRAAIVPVFKSGDRTAPSNYGPISLTSVIIKVLERIIRKQIFGFLYL